MDRARGTHYREAHRLKRNFDDVFGRINPGLRLGTGFGGYAYGDLKN